MDSGDEPEPATKLAWRAGERLPADWPDLNVGQTIRVRLARRPGPGVVLDPGAGLKLAVVEGPAGPRLRWELAMADRSESFGVEAPLSTLPLDGGTVLVRFRRHRLSLWIDGVLVDEEWPMGDPSGWGGTVGVSPEVRAIEVWTEALSDAAIAALGGGADAMAAATDRVLGPAPVVGQGWRPRGFNVNVGDCMPFFHDGVFHLFYLADRRHHAAKRGLGAHEWAHISTRDLRRWTEHPLAVRIEREIEGSICTGSVIFHGGQYRAFYTVRMADRSPAPICRAASDDGEHFVRTGAVAVLAAPYLAAAGRDPHVFRHPATGTFHLLVTTSLVGADGATGAGCLAHLVSDDLERWAQRDPFWVGEDAEQPECPDWFEWRGWFYLVFSLRGIARYRMSRQPLGPWIQPPDDRLDGDTFRVMKTAAFHGGRRLGAAFAAPPGVYGGTLILRELRQRDDGTLHGDWPEELPPA